LHGTSVSDWIFHIEDRRRGLITESEH